jgi:hypothetical protein
MQVSQLQVANDKVQDRLILRIATQSSEEIRVYFTRRFLRELWPYLVSMLNGHLAARPQISAASPSQSEPAATFEKPFREENPRFPLGSTPLLVSEATLEASGEGQARLVLREGRERSVNLNLNADLLQALCAMLRATCEQAKWDMALDYNQATGAVATINAPEKILLH